jgi:hypothetical protein
MGIDCRKFPTFVRMAGNYDSKAVEIFSESGIEYHRDDVTMENAARLMVDKMKKAFPEESD